MTVSVDRDRRGRAGHSDRREYVVYRRNGDYSAVVQACGLRLAAIHVAARSLPEIEPAINSWNRWACHHQRAARTVRPRSITGWIGAAKVQITMDVAIRHWYIEPGRPVVGTRQSWQVIWH